MATITLTDGDFGSGAAARFGEEDLFLPDRARPGLTEVVPFSAVAEVDSVAGDHSARVKAAGKLALRGAAFFGPIGLAAGALAVRNVKGVRFSVRLKDGRGFTATADAGIYAELCSAFFRGRASADVAHARADEVIAKYLEQKQAPAQSALPDASKPAAAAPPAPAMMPPTGDRRLKPRTERPTFGRRGL